MDGLMIFIIILAALAVLSAVCYITSIVLLAKAKNGKKPNILVVILPIIGTLLAYPPAALFGGAVLNVIIMAVIAVLDVILIGCWARLRGSAGQMEKTE